MRENALAFVPRPLLKGGFFLDYWLGIVMLKTMVL